MAEQGGVAVKERTVTIGEDEVYLRDMGDPVGPPIFLVHPIASESQGDEWSWFYKPLVDNGYRVICPDLPGFGRSTGYKVSLNNDELADIAVKETSQLFNAVLKHLGLPTAVFIGYDWGATVLVHYALRFSRRLAKAILFHATNIPPSFPYNKIKQPMLVLWVTPDQLHPLTMGKQLHKRLTRSDLHVVRGGVYSHKKANRLYEVFADQLSSIMLEWLNPWKEQWYEKYANKVEQKEDEGAGVAIEEPVIEKRDIEKVFRGAVNKARERGLDLASIYRVMDRDHQGGVTAENLRMALDDLNVDADDEELTTLMGLLDPSSHGHFTFPDFQRFMGDGSGEIDGLAMAREMMMLLHTAASAAGKTVQGAWTGKDPLKRRDVEAAAKEFELDDSSNFNRLLLYWPYMEKALEGAEEEVDSSDLVIGKQKLLDLLPKERRTNVKKVLLGKAAFGLKVPPTPEPMVEEVKEPPIQSPQPKKGPSLAEVEEVMARFRWLLRRACHQSNRPLASLFHNIPFTPDGCTSVANFKKALQQVGVWLGPEEVACLLRKFDIYGRGDVSLGDFYNYCNAPGMQDIRREEGSRVDVWLEPDVTQYRREEVVLQYWACKKLWRDLRALEGGHHLQQDASDWVRSKTNGVAANEFKQWLSAQAAPWPQVAGEVAVLDFDVLSNADSASDDNRFSQEELSDFLSDAPGLGLDCPLESVEPRLGDASNLKLLAMHLGTSKSWEDVSAEDSASGNWPNICYDGEGRVVSINWSSRELSGSLIPAISRLPAIRALILAENSLNGEFPRFIRSLKYLEHLDLSDNQLHGPIPAWLSELKHLKVLRLKGNKFSGEIPPELFTRQLEIINLSNNKLSGSIPAAVGNASRLRTLWLHDNRLTGSIPVEIHECRALRNINLSGNMHLSGTAPHGFSSMPLEYFAVASTSLSGPITGYIGNPKKVRVLVIADSLIEGPLPDGLHGLRILSAGDSNVGGAIPADIRIDPSVSLLEGGAYTVYFPGKPELRDGAFDMAQRRGYDRRRFVGGLPESLDQSPWRTLYVRGNDWTEEKIKERAALEEFYVGTEGDSWSDNTGWVEMPRDLSTLVGVSVNLRGQVVGIELPENRLASLRGLPDVWRGLPRLQVLNLSGNILLQGRVPLTLLKLRKLSDLNLVATRLNGWPMECAEINSSLLRSLVRYGGHEVRRQDLLAALALYVAAGGGKSVWLRLSPEEWSPTDPLVRNLGDAPTGEELVAMDPAAQHGGLEERKGDDAYSMTWPGMFTEEGRLVGAVLTAGSMMWGDAILPNGLCQADALEELDLALTGVRGFIPPSIINMRSLRVLRLYNSEMVGRFPTPLLLSGAMEDVHVDWSRSTGPRFLLEHTDLSEPRWPVWVHDLADVADTKSLYPTHESNLRITYHMPDGKGTLLLRKADLLDRIQHDEDTVPGYFRLQPRVNPLSRLLLFLSSLLLLGDVITDMAVCIMFAIGNDMGWFAVMLALICAHATAAAWYTATTFKACTPRATISTALSALGMGGLVESCELLFRKAVTVYGYFHLDKPFKITQHIHNLHFIEAMLEAAPALLIQLYARYLQGYGTVEWWGWLSIALSAASVWRAVIIYDQRAIETSAAEALEGRMVHQDRKATRQRIALAKEFDQLEEARLRAMVTSFRVDPKSVGGMAAITARMRSEERQRWKLKSHALKVFRALNRILFFSRSTPTISALHSLVFFVRLTEILATVAMTTVVAVDVGPFVFSIIGEYFVGVTLIMLIPLSFEQVRTVRLGQGTVVPTITSTGGSSEDNVAATTNPTSKPKKLTAVTSFRVPPERSRSYLNALPGLLATAIVSGASAWFFTVSPRFLLPRFLGRYYRHLWRASCVITYTVLLLLKYILGLIFIAVWIDYIAVLSELAIIMAATAAVLVLLLSLIGLSEDATRRGLTTGVWCGTDTIVDGKPVSESRQRDAGDLFDGSNKPSCWY